MSQAENSPETPVPATSGAISNDSDEPHVADKKKSPRTRDAAERSQHTRISGAWAAVFVGVVLGVALIDFIVENTRSVRIDFFSADGRIPVAVALLAAALAGAAVVLVVGVCRTAQLRLSLRRHRRHPSNEAVPSVEPVATEDGQR